MLDSRKPDIVIGTETLLEYDVKYSELFQEEFYDRLLRGVTENLNIQKMSFKTPEEKVWVKITRSRKSPFIVGSYYEPQNRTHDTCKNCAC